MYIKIFTKNTYRKSLSKWQTNNIDKLASKTNQQAWQTDKLDKSIRSPSMFTILAFWVAKSTPIKAHNMGLEISFQVL
jgi:hypothetical protein